MKKRIRIQGILIFLAVIAVIFLSKFIFPNWKERPIDEFLDALGVILVLFGFLFRIVARGYKEEKSAQGKNLVKDGPYLLMRHPMYFGILLIGTGIIFVLFELWTLLVFLAVYLFIYVPQIKREEKALAERFGREYEEYSKEVPRYFPSLERLLNAREYMSLKLSWMRKEFFSLAMVIAAVLVVETWEDIALFGYKEFTKEFLGLFSILIAWMLLVVLFRRKK